MKNMTDEINRVTTSNEPNELKEIPRQNPLWFKQHLFLTTFLAVLILSLIFIIFSPHAIFQGRVINLGYTNNSEVIPEKSGYLLEECYNLCDTTYDLQIQIGICRNNCDKMQRESSTALDKYSNMINRTKRTRQNF